MSVEFPPGSYDEIKDISMILSEKVERYTGPLKDFLDAKDLVKLIASHIRSQNNLQILHKIPKTAL